jgi:hypothetical protein
MSERQGDKTDRPYPIKVRFTNDSATCGYFVTRELEPLSGTPEEKREKTNEELETISEAVVGRQKTNIVIEDGEERELVVDALETFRDGIASPHGGEWAMPIHRKTINRVIEETDRAVQAETNQGGQTDE